MSGKWEMIGPPDCPIMLRREFISWRWLKLMVHRFTPNVEDRDYHDHPRGFVTLVLRGGYDDLTPCEWCLGARELRVPGGSGYDADGTHRPPVWSTIPCAECGETGHAVDRVRAPAIRLRHAEYAHVTRTGSSGALTVVVMGPLRREWGFLRGGRWWHVRDYEQTFGFAFRCADLADHDRRALTEEPSA